VTDTEISTGADLIAAFRAEVLGGPSFVVTGGACAFIIDAIARWDESGSLVVMQHEQSAAMAADAVWRVDGRIGSTVVTSGPGATNLITGICCSWFDSVPTFHISGQVPTRELSAVRDLGVRQLGFQETDIVSMVDKITKFAGQPRSVGELIEMLFDAFFSSVSGRPGPVLVDVPMDVQQDKVTSEDLARFSELVGQVASGRVPETVLSEGPLEAEDVSSARSVEPSGNGRVGRVRSSQSADDLARDVSEFLDGAARPLAVVGGGAVAGGVEEGLVEAFARVGLPYVCSWAALPSTPKTDGLFLGSLGVYGDRLANYAVQNADAIVTFGSRLDSRQRTSRPQAFAPFSRLLVIDVDAEELVKVEETKSEQLDLRLVQHRFDKTQNEIMSGLFADLGHDVVPAKWGDDLSAVRLNYASESASLAELENSPYAFVPPVLELCAEEAWTVVADCGANLCWVYQSIGDLQVRAFTAGGHSPMGYSLPAAVGAASCGETTVAFIGDGGLQMCVQELQTVRHRRLPIAIVVLNNFGYGIIKQFQDSNLGGRYVASGSGYSQPDWGAIADAYGLRYAQVTGLSGLPSALAEMRNCLEVERTPILVDLHLDDRSPIAPKVDGDRFLHTQWPDRDHGDQEMFFDYPERPSLLG